MQPEESLPGSPPRDRSARRWASPRRADSGQNWDRNQPSGRRPHLPPPPCAPPREGHLRSCPPPRPPLSRARPPTGWRHLGALSARVHARAARRRRAPAATPNPRPRAARAHGTPASGTAAAPARPAPAPEPTPGLALGTHQLRVKVEGRRRRRSTVTRVQSRGRDGAAPRGPRRAGCGLGALGGAAAVPAAGWRLQRVGPGGATAGDRAADCPERRERNWLSQGSAERSQLLPGARICILRREGGEVTVWPLPKVWVFGVAVARALMAEKLSLSSWCLRMWSRWGPASSCDRDRRIFQGDLWSLDVVAWRENLSRLLCFFNILLRIVRKRGGPGSRGAAL